jgi:hypothetical protein
LEKEKTMNPFTGQQEVVLNELHQPAGGAP